MYDIEATLDISRGSFKNLFVISIVELFSVDSLPPIGLN
jgi:hypothetical protein